ncbi:MAG: 1,4-dihydroxy-6-naphthoate synthase, partial [Pirellulaceae bacterium]|nr:1,4-dihydroxy-6-naphthoate synthase [Pirellulaceae bacterium]
STLISNQFFVEKMPFIMSTRLKLGISTCPNDTFAFHAILNKKVDLRGLKIEVSFYDIKELNDRLFSEVLDIGKGSFYAALRLSDKYRILSSGAALGYGVGPLLLAAKAGTTPESLKEPITLCPGKYTTANMLYELYYPNCGKAKQIVFSEIMPALQKKEAEFGVCIHEGRFTWKESGLALVEDLGLRWEKESGQPLPLGGIFASKKLSHKTVQAFTDVLKDSIHYGQAHRQETLSTMRKHAQEFSDAVLFSHVDLYVNESTIDLGNEGKMALEVLFAKAKSAGLLPNNQPRLEFV